MSEQPEETPVDLSAVAKESPEASTAAEEDAVDGDVSSDTGDLVPPDREQ